MERYQTGQYIIPILSIIILIPRLVLKWSEIDRILQLDSDAAHHACCSSHPSGSNDASIKPQKSITTWTDAWQVYEDVCIICAGLWMGSWRGNSTASYSTAGGAENWGSVRLEGDDDLSLGAMGVEGPNSGSSKVRRNPSEGGRDSPAAYVRNVGMGIEGRPVEGSGLGYGLGLGGPSTKTARRTSAVSWSSGKATVVGSVSGHAANGKARQASTSTSAAGPSSATPASPSSGSNGDAYAQGTHHSAEEENQRHAGQVLTTMAVLQTFHAHTAFQLSVLEDLLAKQEDSRSTAERVVYLTPKDILSFELGPLSGFDARYLEWLAGEYAGDGVRVVVKRGWKDLLGAIFGYG